jgi:hypothetical protein
VLLNARPQDPPQKVGFVDDHWLMLRDGLAAVQESDGRLYFAIPLRNVATGLAVLHGWPRRAAADVAHAPVEEFRRLQRDLYVPAGDVSFWQGAVRDPADPQFVALRAAIRDRTGMSVEILYGDHEGGQRTITRLFVTPRTASDAEDPWLWICSATLHYNLDRADPR